MLPDKFSDRHQGLGLLYLTIYIEIGMSDFITAKVLINRHANGYVKFAKPFFAFIALGTLPDWIKANSTLWFKTSKYLVIAGNSGRQPDLICTLSCCLVGITIVHVCSFVSNLTSVSTYQSNGATINHDRAAYQPSHHDVDYHQYE